MPNALPSIADDRRTDLDWLRIGAFALLILYHVGMFYTPDDWGWHVKSAWSSEPLTWLMYLTNPWRLGLLFLVSGAAIRFMTRRQGPGALARSRTARLLPPLLFGMLVIVPPQSYYQLVEQAGFTASYLDFYPAYLRPGAFTWNGQALRVEGGEPLLTPTWNHLWFVTYLWAYTLLLAALLAAAPRFTAVLEATAERAARSLGGWGVLVWPWLVLAAARVLLLPLFDVTHALVDDWYNHATSLFLFLFGYAAARNGTVWSALDRVRWPATIIAVVSYLAWAGYAWTFREVEPADALKTLMRVVWAADQWAWIAALLAWGRRYLSGRDGPVRRYLTDAIFPFYIIHQTAIVVFGFHLTRMNLPAPVEATALIGLSLAACFATYEVVRRVGMLRPLFGLKSAEPLSSRPSRRLEPGPSLV